MSAWRELMLNKPKPTKELNFAIEYCGKGWHELEDAIKRDKEKEIVCKNKNINLLKISERSRKYEEDIKTQTIEHLNFINKFTNRNFTEKDINNVIIDYSIVYNQYDLDDIKSKISECSSINEFSKK